MDNNLKHSLICHILTFIITRIIYYNLSHNSELDQKIKHQFKLDPSRVKFSSYIMQERVDAWQTNFYWRHLLCHIYNCFTNKIAIFDDAITIKQTTMPFINFKTKTFFSCLDSPTLKNLNLMMDRNTSFGIAYFQNTSTFCILARKFVSILHHGDWK